MLRALVDIWHNLVVIPLHSFVPSCNVDTDFPIRVWNYHRLGKKCDKYSFPSYAGELPQCTGAGIIVPTFNGLALVSVVQAIADRAFGC